MSVSVRGVDFDFRSSPYFWPLSADKHLLSTIKGAARRRRVAEALEAGDLTNLPESCLKPALSSWQLGAISSIHPSLMGGEYLPTPVAGEIEIGRITLASTLTDVMSVLAKRSGSRIAYRIVDEYEGRTLDGGRTTRTSMRPLSLREFADFFWAPTGSPRCSR